MLSEKGQEMLNEVNRLLAGERGTDVFTFIDDWSHKDEALLKARFELMKLDLGDGTEREAE